jgi:predicted nucleic acid-binding Zn ribbon protein
MGKLNGICVVCRTPFSTYANRSKSCSPHCQKIALRQRVQRKQMKAKEAALIAVDAADDSHKIKLQRITKKFLALLYREACG